MYLPEPPRRQSPPDIPPRRPLHYCPRAAPRPTPASLPLALPSRPLCPALDTEPTQKPLKRLWHNDYSITQD